MEAHAQALGRAHRRALEWLADLDRRPVPPRSSIEEVAEALGRVLPDQPTEAADVVDLLVDACDKGLTAMPSGRFFGFVIGGTHPAALAVDWLVSAWDQNCALRAVTPAHTAVEDIAATWVLDLLGLPPESAVGFVTGGTMANYTCLAAGRDAVLRSVGWNVSEHGLAGGPRVRVLVGAERHETVDLALRYLGLGAPQPVAADDQGRIRPEALVEALGSHRGEPTIVVLQAGNVHSGAYDPFAEAVGAARSAGAWVHVDGAFGLWAAASPGHRHLVEGYGDANSWSTDAHKTLNVPYDTGLAVVRDQAALRAAMGMEGAYLTRGDHSEPLDKVPELSRRGRAFPVWAVLRALGRNGVAELVDRLCRHARAFADGLSAIPGATVLNDVVFTQVCARFGSDDRTDEVARQLLVDGTTWMSASTWHGERVLRVSVSNWATTGDDVDRSLDAIRAAVSKL